MRRIGDDLVPVTGPNPPDRYGPRGDVHRFYGLPSRRARELIASPEISHRLPRAVGHQGPLIAAQTHDRQRRAGHRAAIPVPAER